MQYDGLCGRFPDESESSVRMNVRSLADQGLLDAKIIVRKGASALPAGRTQDAETVVEPGE